MIKTFTKAVETGKFDFIEQRDGYLFYLKNGIDRS
jgi:hypothetical protein